MRKKKKKVCFPVAYSLCLKACKMGKQIPSGEIVSGDNWTFQLFADRVLKGKKKSSHLCNFNAPFRRPQFTTLFGKGFLKSLVFPTNT